MASGKKTAAQRGGKAEKAGTVRSIEAKLLARKKLAKSGKARIMKK